MPMLKAATDDACWDVSVYDAKTPCKLSADSPSVAAIHRRTCKYANNLEVVNYNDNHSDTWTSMPQHTTKSLHLTVFKCFIGWIHYVRCGKSSGGGRSFGALLPPACCGRTDQRTSSHAYSNSHSS